MIVKIFIRRQVPAECEMEAFELLNRLRSKAMDHPGYISGETLVSTNDHSEIMVVSTWQHLENWNSWKDSEKRKTIDAQLEALQVKPTEYEPFVSTKHRLAVKSGFPAALG